MPFFSSEYLLRSLAYLGTSITAAATYCLLTNEFIRTQSPFPSLTYTNAGIGGSTSWYALASQLAVIEAAAPTAVCIDFGVNDEFTDFYAKTAEALIRRIRTRLPAASVVFIAFTRVGSNLVDDPTNLNQNIKDRWFALAARYGLQTADFAQALVDVVGAGAHVATYLSDTVHPTATGHALAASVLEPVMRNATAGFQMPALPARLYDCADFEADPIVRLGTDNNGETGTWSTSGTGRQSSVAGSTISWVGTFVSFGTENEGTGLLEWQIDGGAWSSYDLNTHGVGGELSGVALARAQHTLVLRVVSGTVKINRFLAI